MITLTRLNGRPVVLNEDMIETLEELPDTTVLLFTGNKIIVKESAAEVMARAQAWARGCAQQRKPARRRVKAARLRRR